MSNLYFKAKKLPIALSMDWMDLTVGVLEILVNRDLFLNVDSVIHITSFSFNELSKHGRLVVKNKLLFIFFPITVA